MRRLRWLLILAGAVGSFACASLGIGVGDRGPEITVSLKAATADAWKALGRTDEPPDVKLVVGTQLSCTDPVSGHPGFPVAMLNGMDCREGYTVTPWFTVVAERQPWSDSALIHELLHVAQLRSGIVDPNHTRAEWTTIVPVARAALQARGQ